MGIFFRPYLNELLENIYKTYDVHIYTSSDKEYADLILKQIDPQRKYFQERWYKNSCVRSQNGQFIKDLRTVGSNLARTVLIDNSCFSFGHQLLNGVPIISYTGSITDTELMALQDYLHHLNRQSDVRKANIDYFKMPLYIDSQDMDTVYSKIFA